MRRIWRAGEDPSTIKLVAVLCNWRDDIGVWVFSHVGDIPDDELLDTYQRFYETHPDAVGTDYLVDLRKTGSNRRSSAALRRVAALVKRYTPGAGQKPKIAIVAPADLSFGMGRVYQAVSTESARETSVFRDLEPALAWLAERP